MYAKCYPSSSSEDEDMGSAELNPKPSLIASTSGIKANGHRRSPLSNPQRGFDLSIDGPSSSHFSWTKSKGISGERKSAAAMLSKDQDEPLDFSSKSRGSSPSPKTSAGESSAERREWREEAGCSSFFAKSVKTEAEEETSAGSSRDNAIKLLLNRNNHPSTPKSAMHNHQGQNELLLRQKMARMNSKNMQNGGERDHQPASSKHISPPDVSSSFNPFQPALYASASSDHCSPSSIRLPNSYASHIGIGARYLDGMIPHMSQSDYLAAASTAMKLETEHIAWRQYQLLSTSLCAQAPAFPGLSSRANGAGGFRGPAPDVNTRGCSNNSNSISPHPVNGRPIHRVRRRSSLSIRRSPLPDLTHHSTSSSMPRPSPGSTDLGAISPSTSAPSRSPSETPVMSPMTDDSPSAISNLMLTANAEALYQQNGHRRHTRPRESVSPCSSEEREPRRGTKRAAVPNEMKDQAYFDRRKKNNEAAKRSRDARKAKESEIATRAAFLEQENLRLRVEQGSLRHEIHELRGMLYHSNPLQQQEC